MNNVDEKYVRKGYVLAKRAIENHDMTKLIEELENCPHATEYWRETDRTLLHIAARDGTPEFIEYLVNLGMDIDRVEDDKSPLSVAAMHDKAENVKKLIELGAKLDATVSFNNPIFFAIQLENVDIAKMLIEAGIDLTPVYKTKDNPWWDTLSYAKYYKQAKIVELIESSLNVQRAYVDNKEEDVYVDDYIERSLGKFSDSFVDVAPVSKVSVTVNIIMPDEKRSYITLVTTGMCDEPMAETSEGLKYAELIMKLPAYWKTGLEMLTSPEYNWPIRILRKVAHLAHLHEGLYIDESVIIPYGKPGEEAEPFTPDTKFSSVMICRSDDIQPYMIDAETTIDFFTLIPISVEEEEIVRKFSSKKVMEMIKTRDVIDLKRDLLV